MEWLKDRIQVCSLTHLTNNQPVFVEALLVTVLGTRDSVIIKADTTIPAFKELILESIIKK